MLFASQAQNMATFQPISTIYKKTHWLSPSFLETLIDICSDNYKFRRVSVRETQLAKINFGKELHITLSL